MDGNTIAVYAHGRRIALPSASGATKNRPGGRLLLFIVAASRGKRATNHRPCTAPARRGFPRRNSTPAPRAARNPSNRQRRRYAQYRRRNGSHNRASRPVSVSPGRHTAPPSRLLKTPVAAVLRECRRGQSPHSDNPNSRRAAPRHGSPSAVALTAPDVRAVAPSPPHFQLAPAASTPRRSAADAPGCRNP